ncbi:hypothetical protein CRG98_031374 [Punica granatum]|uniref:Uncharacterized protein n=1 Tax=Punica granatum TaxID=22663 RepID=A0A2I0IW38_PUNGR|nr:hypothetical protein CRG98_031374 [Punica granatum]
MEKRETRGPIYFGIEEATLDPYGPRELSATSPSRVAVSSHGSRGSRRALRLRSKPVRIMPIHLIRQTTVKAREKTNFGKEETVLASGESRELMGPSLGTRPWAPMALPWPRGFSYLNPSRFPSRYIHVKRASCTVERLSDRDHLFTGESVGREGPFARDGTTRRSRGKKWHVVEVRVRPMTVSGPDSLAVGRMEGLSHRFWDGASGEEGWSRGLGGQAEGVRGVRTRMWTLVGARITRFWIARLGSVHLPLGTRDGQRERSSRHLSFYDPKVEGR